MKATDLANQNASYVGSEILNTVISSRSSRPLILFTLFDSFSSRKSSRYLDRFDERYLRT